MKNGPLLQKIPTENGYPFQPKWPLKMGRGFEAQAAHPHPNQIWVPPSGVEHTSWLDLLKGGGVMIDLVIKGLAMIFADQENPFIIFRSKEMNMYIKTSYKIPINLLK